MAVTVVYKGSQITSFSSATKTLKTSGKYLEDDIAVSVKCTVTITGTGSSSFCYVQHKGVKYYSATTFDITPGDQLNLFVNATGGQPTSTIKINGEIFAQQQNNSVSAVITPEYDTTINLKTGGSATIDATFPVITSGTYSVSSAGTKHIYKYTRISVPAGSVSISNTSATITPAITVSADGVITATASGSASVTPTVTAGYISSASAGNVTITGSSSTQLSTQGASTIIPTETQQTAVASGKYTTGAITVAGISSDYVGTAVTRRSSADLTVSGSTVTAPSGFYSSNASANVAAGSAFTPATTITTNPSITVDANGLVTATVSNYRNITPTVNEGYIVSGTSGKVQASGSSTYQLSTQGASTITPTEAQQTAVASGKYTTGNVVVAGISSNYVGSAIPTRSQSDLGTNGATVTIPSGYYSENVAKEVSSGSATTPVTTITVTPAITVNASGLITATANGSSNITPTVNAGYVTVGTAGRVSVSGSNTSQLTTRGASSYTPTTTAQTIPSGIYLTGTQTINAIPSQYIVPTGTLSISANATGINVSQYASVDVNVPTPSFVTYYTGTSAPSNSLGSNGDIYLQTTE